MTGSGLIKSLLSDRCLRAYNRELVTSCGAQNTPEMSWFLNGRGYVRSSFGRCLSANGTNVEVIENCAYVNHGKKAIWEVVPYVPVMVSNDSPVQHAGQGIMGNIVTTTLYAPARKRTVCSTQGCNSQGITNHELSWHYPGEDISIEVHGPNGFENVYGLSHWTNAPCKSKTSNPCTFKIDPKTDPRTGYKKIAFVIGNTLKPREMARAFNMQQGKNCVTIDAKGDRPIMAPCKDGNINQIFVDKFGNDSGMMHASMMAPAYCIYPSTNKALKEIVQAPKCGKASHELPKGAGFPRWVYTESGHVRFAPNLRDCLEVNGKSIVKALCDVNNKSQMFKFANAAALKGNIMQVHASGRCIDNTGSTKQGAQMHAFRCDRKNKNQEFVFMPGTGAKAGGEIRIAKSGMCLDVSGGSKSDRAEVIQWPCHGKANQRWRVVDVGFGWKNIVSVHSGKCLDLQGGKMEDRVKFIQYTCGKNNRAQMFRDVTNVSNAEINKHFETAQARLDRPGPRTFVSRYSGKCIDNTGSTKRGVQMHQFTCYKNAPNQQFMLIDRGDRFTYSLKNVKSGLCMNVSGNSTKNQGKIIQWPCDNAKNSGFWFDYEKKNGKRTGWFRIRPENSTKNCLDVRGPSKDDRAKIQQWECNNVPQHWFREFKG
jgi:hypothetical protein